MARAYWAPTKDARDDVIPADVMRHTAERAQESEQIQ